MSSSKKRKPAEPNLDLTRFKTYEELKKCAAALAGKTTPQENWAIMERMRQLRYGYEPGSLRMDKTKIEFTQYSLEEFREITEREYAEEIKKYGPR